MIIVMQHGASAKQIAGIVARVETMGYRAHLSQGEERTIIGVIGDERLIQREHLAMLPRVDRPMTVFLTIGQWQMGTDRLILEALDSRRLSIPPGIACQLHDLAVTHLLTKAYDFGITLREAVEAVSAGHARYIGVRLEPKGKRVASLTETRPCQ